MIDDLLRDIVRYGEYAAEIQRLISSAYSKAPRTSQGTDQKGVVSIAIGRGGFPDSFDVAVDWRNRVSPHSFDAAVAEASRDAAHNRLDVWARALEQEGWRNKLDRLKQGSGRGETGNAQELPPALRRRPIERTPRHLSDIAEEVMGRIDVLGSSPTSNGSAASGTGADRNRHVLVSLQADGLLACKTNPEWVAQQGAAHLAQALKEATDAARRNLVAGMKEESAKSGLDDAFDELMTLLKFPDHLGR